MAYYPEIEHAGSLSCALRLEFAKISSSLVVEEEPDKLPFSYARVKHGHRFSQIYIAAQKKLYLTDFWREGVCLAHAQIESIADVVEAIGFWLRLDVTTKMLVERYSFVKPEVKAVAFDENRAIEYTWNHLWQDESRSELSEFVELAMKDAVLGRLFPFTSLYTLCFSRCTGYPYDTVNLPNVSPKLTGYAAAPRGKEKKCELYRGTLFVVRSDEGKYLGEGSASETLAIVRKHLPADVQPARKGTAGEL